MKLLNRRLIIFLLISSFILTHIPVVLCMAPPIVYVAGDGSGDFNCDGTEDHVQINEALKLVSNNTGYTTVHLKGPFTYVISNTLLIGNNTVLEGDSNAKIKLVNNARWAAWKPMIKESKSGSSNIEIRGFTIDGNRAGNTNVGSGRGYYNLIHLRDCQNISVHNMNLTNNHGDGLKTDGCSNIKYYDNTIFSLGHDGLYASICSNIEAYNNKIACRTNSGLRIYNSNHVKFHDNIITSDNGGGAGIEIQKYETSDMDDIEVYNNIIYKTALSGIFLFGMGPYSASATNVYIHHNQIYDTGTDTGDRVIGGIFANGFNVLIENNVIDGAYGAGIMQNREYTPPGSGYVLTVRNNIISNTRRPAVVGNGSGICSLLPAKHSYILQNNCFYNNPGGNYVGINASTSDITADIIADPEFANRGEHDYHLKSKAGRWDGKTWVCDNNSSLCIDAGYPDSDYSNEPEDNGDRINIGAYGNTAQASKSGLYVPGNGGGDSNGGGSNSGGGSSSGGSGGGGGSPEPATNVQVKESSQAYISNGQAVKFDFTQNVTSVLYVSFDSNKSMGKTTAKVEMLKGKSALVSALPSDEVYKSLDIWVGDGGFGTSKYITNAVVCFRVEKAWIKDKNIDQASISLNRYSDNKWCQLPSSLSGEDNDYLYFTAKTPGFSPFAITGKLEAKVVVTEIPKPSPSEPSQHNGSMGSNVEKTPVQTENSNNSGKSNNLPGFEIVSCIVCLLCVLICERR
jgi:PGF-pre-PGF domain-containing protein